MVKPNAIQDIWLFVNFEGVDQCNAHIPNKSDTLYLQNKIYKPPLLFKAYPVCSKIHLEHSHHVHFGIDRSQLGSCDPDAFYRNQRCWRSSPWEKPCKRIHIKCLVYTKVMYIIWTYLLLWKFLYSLTCYITYACSEFFKKVSTIIIFFPIKEQFTDIGIL